MEVFAIKNGAPDRLQARACTDSRMRIQEGVGAGDVPDTAPVRVLTSKQQRL
jgi:hypothetical protein